MEDGTVVTQIDTNQTSREMAPQVAALTGDTRTDLAAIAKEMGVSMDGVGNVTPVKTQAQPAPVTPSPVPVQAAHVETAPVEVPTKFQNPDGTVNEQKLEKSTKSLEEGLAYYRAKEKEFQQAQNKVNNPPATIQTQAPQTPAYIPQNTQLSPLEIQMAQDLISEHAAQGMQLDQRAAIAQARVMARGLEARHAADRSMSEEIRNELEDGKRQRELEGLLAGDADLMTPQVADRIIEIKRTMGFPSYRAAYAYHLGEQEIAKRTGQVKTPNPTGQAARPPVTPVGPVSRVQSTVPVNPKAMTDEQLLAKIKEIHPRYRGLNK